MNKLKLNENKTKLLEINMDNIIIFTINNVIIEKGYSIKYLGFIIDKELTYNIEFICKKIGEKSDFFKRIRNKMSIITSINIYNRIIKPHFEFGSTILNTCCSDQQIIRLQKIQNKAMPCNMQSKAININKMGARYFEISKYKRKTTCLHHMIFFLFEK